MSTDEILNLDLYEIIGVCRKATVSEINSAYRKKALGYHPDKCSNDPKLADLFLQLKRAKDILTDPTAKANYDRRLKAREGGCSGYTDYHAWEMDNRLLEEALRRFIIRLFERQRQQAKEEASYSAQHRYHNSRQASPDNMSDRKKATIKRMRKKLMQKKMTTK